MQLWHAWLVLVIALLALELLTFTLALAALAVGALLAGALAFLGLDFVWQLTGLGAGTLIGFLGARPFVLKRLGRGDASYRSNLEAAIGQDCEVLEVLRVQNPGRVMLNGEEWRAIPAADIQIPPGRRVTVVDVTGNRLVVVESLESGG